MTAEAQINTLDIFHDKKLVATIVVEEPIELLESGQMGFKVLIGSSEVIISAESIEIKKDNS